MAANVHPQNQQICLSVARLLVLCLVAMFLIETAYALCMVAYLQLNPPIDYGRPFILVLWGVHTLKFIALAYFVGHIIARDLSRRVSILGQNLVYTTGIIRVDDKIYGLGQLRSISVDQGLLGKMFHYGDIHLTFGASGYTESLCLDGVHEPKRYEDLLEAYLGRRGQPPREARVGETQG